MKLCPKCQKHFSDDANFCPTDAARLVPLEGQGGGTDSLSSRFELGDTKLGGTRTGTVIRAKDKQGGAAVAVKLIAPAVVALPGVAQRLERELKQIERVQSAGVAKVLASGKRMDESWVAMEWLEGAQTLAEAIGARGPIPLEQAANLIEVIGEALIEAAQVGVVHRDLAPKNVLFAGNEIKLINFSLPVPTSPNVPGVPEFVAPEQVEGKPVDQRSNLYSLGALYYFVLTGQAPAAGNIKPPSQIAAVPAAVEAAIMRALDKSPTKRFLTVRQFVDEVSRIAKGDATTAGSTQPMGKVGKPKAELMQTLLGVRSGINGAPAMPPAATPMQQVATGTPIASAPTVGAGVPAIAAAPAAQMPMATVVGLAPGSLGPIPGGSPANVAERSPWAPPATGNPVATVGAEPALAPMAMAVPAAAVAALADVMPPPSPPILAAPVLPASPVLAAPVVAGGKDAGKKKGDDAKGKFRETMWFKKGDLDAQAAVAAAEERARTGQEVTTDKADTMPIDERYKDDGSITRGDKDKYSLRTGGTMMMSSVKDPGGAGASMSKKVSEGDLIGEMKGGRSWVIILIVAGVLGLGFLLFMIAR